VMFMKRTSLLALSTALLFSAPLAPVLAQTAPGAPGTDQVIPEKDRTRPEDLPKSQGGGGSDLSNKLDKSEGVLKPSTNLDPAMQKPAPAPNAGTMPVITPPGEPGGRQDVQPK